MRESLKIRIDHLGARILVLAVLAASMTVRAQPWKTIVDGYTPRAAEPGTPAGSYALSDIETINLFNGKLNVRLPLYTLSDRGEVSHTVMLQLQRNWVTQKQYQDGVGLLMTIYDSAWLDSGLNLSLGRVQGRVGAASVLDCGSYQTAQPNTTLLRLTYKAGDGSELELRDQKYKGEPRQNNLYCTASGADRGRIFEAFDGSAMSFIADTSLADALEATAGDVYVPVSGYLYSRNGQVLRVTDSQVTSVRDRNGNVLSAIVENGQIVGARSPRGREVRWIAGPDTWTISYPGANGALKAIVVRYDLLSNRLFGAAATRKLSELFPDGFHGVIDVGGPYNPRVVSRVELPNGTAYDFYYNAHGEATKIVLPTGGRYEYEWRNGLTGGVDGGVFPGAVSTDADIVYRRVVRRRAYNADGSLLLDTEYSAADTDPGSSTLGETVVTVVHRNGGGVELRREVHSFHASPRQSVYRSATGYAGFKEGKEFQTEYPALQRIQQQWGQNACAGCWFESMSELHRPEYNPHVNSRTQTWLNAAGNPSSQQTFSYDLYNNVTSETLYDYGGAEIRTTATSYNYTASAIGTSAPGVPDGTPVAHLRSLVDTVEVRRSGVVKARHSLEYDQYDTLNGHAPLLTYSSPAGYQAPPGARGNVTTWKWWLAEQSRYLNAALQYDQLGNVVKVINPRGYATAFEYGSAYQYAYVTRQTNPLAQSVLWTYMTGSGQVASQTDPNGVPIIYSYDSSGVPEPLDRLKRITRATGVEQSQTTFDYDDLGRCVTARQDQIVTGDARQVSRNCWDGLGRSSLSAYLAPEGEAATQKTYDGLGRLIQECNPRLPGEPLACTTYQYDALDRPILITHPGNAQTSIEYTGAETRTTDPAGRVIARVANAAGQIVKVTEPGPNDTLYAYDAAGNLVSVTYSPPNTARNRSFQYDSLSRLTLASNPESGAIQYEYDDNGNLTRKTDALGRWVQMSYDAADRIISKTYSDATPPVSFTYDEALEGYTVGRLTRVTSGGIERRYVKYHPHGHVRKVRQIQDSVTYEVRHEWNLAGAEIETVLPSGRTLTTSYDVAGRPVSVSGVLAGAGKTYASQARYTAAGQLAEVRRGGGSWQRWEARTYNERLQAWQVMVGTAQSGWDRLRLTLGYGTASSNNGNVMSQQIEIPGKSWAQSYGYDGLNRLVSASETAWNSGQWARSFGYDRWGNLWRSGGVNDDVHPFTPVAQSNFNDRNQLLIQNSIYDAAGNQTAIGGFTFAYDAENRLVSSTLNSITTNYVYDGEGRRVKKTRAGQTTAFVYDGLGRLVAEYGGTAALTGTVHLVQDHLGNVRLLEGENGVVRRYDYKPFGEALVAGVNGRAITDGYESSEALSELTTRFTGKERDQETGLDFFEARYFSSAQGRFTSPDPITVTPGRVADPQQLNLYAYARNNPLKYVDPTGMIIDLSQLSEEDKKKWAQIQALANQKDANGNFVNAKLHEAYARLDTDSRTFVIVNENLGPGTAGQFTITKFNGPNDFSEAKVALNFKTIKGINSTTRGDFDPSFMKYEGLLGKNGFIPRLAETFGHEAFHGIFALDNLQQGTQIQRLLNERDATLQALPAKGRYPLPPDVLQKMQAADKALIPTERFAQQAEKIINGELKASQVKK